MKNSNMLEIVFGKATRGNTAERKYIFSQLLQIEAQIEKAKNTVKEPMCGMWALEQVRDGYVKDIENLSQK